MCAKLVSETLVHPEQCVEWRKPIRKVQRTNFPAWDDLHNQRTSGAEQLIAQRDISCVKVVQAWAKMVDKQAPRASFTTHMKPLPLSMMLTLLEMSDSDCTITI
jgi:hypothetical protein